jgi:putrescine aminotransferase
VNPLAATLAEEIASLAPPGLEMVFFTSSGSESVEAALKLARAVTQRTGFLSCKGGYHGKTFGALSVSGNPRYQRPFAPLVPDTSRVPFGDAEALGLALASHCFAALIVEPIQGEGGMNVPPPGYLTEAQRLCRKTGTLLIVDEVQTGLGRTGEMFAVNHEGVEPDVLTLAKSLGGGMLPLGAMLTRRDLWRQAYGTLHTFALHTSTFSGGSWACAAGLATLRVLRDGQLLENARQRGKQLVSGLTELCQRCSLLRAVRGQGLMLGLEFNALSPTLLEHFKGMDASPLGQFLIPDLDTLAGSLPAVYVMNALLQDHGIYSQVTRSNPLVLRVQPPLTITEEQVEHFLDAVKQCSSELAMLLDTVDSVLARSIGEHKLGS